MKQTTQSCKKERFTAQLPQELIEKARNAVYWTPGLTLAELTQTALENLINQLELERGEPFPPRSGKLKTGRPIQ